MDDPEPNEEEQQMEVRINKEIDKLKYYLEQTDDLINEKDYKEMETVSKRTTSILDEIYNLVSRMQEVKVERGTYTARTIRQWKKNTKDKYSPWIAEINKLADVLTKRNNEIANEEEKKKREEKLEEEQQHQALIRHRERQLWQEKLQAELEMTEKKLAMEKTAKRIQAKLPKLTITPFKGTAADWVRFENMFITQVDSKPITEEEKFGYLLEMVSGKVRDKISNLKPGSLGYKIAWERLKKEY